MKLLAAGSETRPRKPNLRITDKQIARLEAELNDGKDLKQASSLAGVSYSWAKLHRSKLPKAPKKATALNERAQRGLTDFEFFRRVYLGHVSMPWQIEFAETVVQKLASPDKEYIVANEPPGSGKSTLLHDVACWVTVKDRTVRGLIGSATSRKARDMIGRLRDTFSRTAPVRANDYDLKYGLACDAEATLAQDYGNFKPAAGEKKWSEWEFTVLQFDDAFIDDKEKTWAAYGMDQDFLGGRYDIIFWDDVVTDDQVRTVESLEKQRRWWDTTAQSRLEPGGCLFLVGQRIASNDLYRHCLDKKVLPDDDDLLDELDALRLEDRKRATADFEPMYTHIVYKAHDDEHCLGRDYHKRDSAPQPEGCLLDPRRLTWRELRALRSNDPQTYATWYQQQDADPHEALVKPVWVTGGIDPEEGTQHQGCWDKERLLAEFPKGITGPKYSIGTVDPSPTKMWAIQWWIYAPEASHQLFLMDTVRRSMPANEVLDFNPNTQLHYGVLEDWQVRSEQLGFPISHWIFEVNAAQRWFVGMESTQAWLRRHMGVQIISHTTTSRKTDPELGVPMIRDWWRSGRIRLPGKGMEARTASLKLVEEVQRYPNAHTDDQVMANWFALSHLPTISAGWDIKEIPKFNRPSWLTGGRG